MKSETDNPISNISFVQEADSEELIWLRK